MISIKIELNDVEVTQILSPRVNCLNLKHETAKNIWELATRMFYSGTIRTNRRID